MSRRTDGATGWLSAYSENFQPVDLRPNPPSRPRSYPKSLANELATAVVQQASNSHATGCQLLHLRVVVRRDAALQRACGRDGRPAGGLAAGICRASRWAKPAVLGGRPPLHQQSAGRMHAPECLPRSLLLHCPRLAAPNSACAGRKLLLRGILQRNSGFTIPEQQVWRYNAAFDNAHQVCLVKRMRHTHCLLHEHADKPAASRRSPPELHAC